MSDTELDETFDNPIPVVDFKMPNPLSQEELQKLHEYLKNKSNKELLNLISDISIKHNPNLNDMQKMQMIETLKQNMATTSKRELINTLSQIVNQSNKNLVFEDSSELKTLNTEQLTREQLREKLRQKRTMSDKKKMVQMMQNFQDELTATNSVNEQTQHTKQNNTENKKKNKKKKKASQSHLQQQLINKMTELMKSNLDK